MIYIFIWQMNKHILYVIQNHHPQFNHLQDVLSAVASRVPRLRRTLMQIYREVNVIPRGNWLKQSFLQWAEKPTPRYTIVLLFLIFGANTFTLYQTNLYVHIY